MEGPHIFFIVFFALYVGIFFIESSKEVESRKIKPNTGINNLDACIVTCLDKHYARKK